MRDCENCKHRVMKVEVGKGTPPEHFWGCECWECKFEPTTKNDLGVDLISRADAIKAMQDKAKKLKNEDTINGLCGAVAILYELPSATPQEPKTGHWIEHEKSISTAFKQLRECSCCKCYFDWMMPRNSYCPNCGAKMDKEQAND